MKKPIRWFGNITSVILVLSASLTMAQQATPESSPPMQMQSRDVAVIDKRAKQSADAKDGQDGRLGHQNVRDVHDDDAKGNG
jgi:hypothetical protein